MSHSRFFAAELFGFVVSWQRSCGSDPGALPELSCDVLVDYTFCRDVRAATVFYLDLSKGDLGTFVWSPFGEPRSKAV